MKKIPQITIVITNYNYEKYLQRCVFNDSIGLEKMVENPITGNYLENCQKKTKWEFSQKVMMIFFENKVL